MSELLPFNRFTAVEFLYWLLIVATLTALWVWLPTAFAFVVAWNLATSMILESRRFR